ncbi:hypothetical protein LPC08_25300 (plasmid) [Roseomonas sp. OT10]|uniref:hypothetical protein n=1 Tax=Roseomonas cutis TaxID=2897332 RepID=UPI001E3F9A59|nr:hypothetical protein [Roseomonas sp. OT10]UFN51583.1 hypothetical protein LPC08_25300 [Roseomonas sp. OT10]
MSTAPAIDRISRNVASRAARLGTDIRPAFAAITAKWVLDEPGRVTGKESERMRMTGTTLEVVDYVIKTLSWMGSKKNHHGQQATDIARKTLRALKEDLVGFDDLHGLCKQFQSVRKNHINRNSEVKQRAEPASIALSHRLGGRVVRLTTEKDLKRAGHALRNCLANPDFASDYAQLLRKGESAFHVLETADGESAAVLQVSLPDMDAEQVKGAGNSRPIKYRARIMEAMRLVGINVGDCRDLWSIGVCDEVLAHPDAIQSFKVGVKGTLYRFDVIPGALVMRWDDEVALLRSAGWGSYRAPIYWSTWTSDIDCVDDYVGGALARSALRQACSASKALALACRKAFADAPLEFVEDWFGFRR